jgi:dihydroneopterin aldolase
MKTKGTVSLEGLEFFAHHGVYDFERKEGNTFWVDIFMTQHYTDEALGNLDDTVDYEKVFALIDEVMQQPEPLIETVAKKIIKSITKEFPKVEQLKVKIKKNKPPIKNATLNYSAFELEWIKPNV